MNNPTPAQFLKTATWDDAPHLTEKVKEDLLESFPVYQREMRTKGIPLMGEGLIFLMPEDKIKEPGLESVPNHWPRIIGMDFGWDHPTAVVWCVYDRGSDIIHVYDAWRDREKTPAEVASVIRGRPDDWIPVSWPHDGLQHDKGSGEQLAQQYRDQGVNMLQNRATFEDGSNGLEAGIFEMYERMASGRLKIASHLHEWFEEYRLYHRSKGKPVKLKDDLLCATRYAMMMIREAETKPVYNHEIDDTPPNETWY
jgi:hypothetical protein